MKYCHQIFSVEIIVAGFKVSPVDNSVALIIFVFLLAVKIFLDAKQTNFFVC